jgi:hypothetical protein
MTPDRLRQLESLTYFDPKVVLQNLRKIEMDLPEGGIDQHVRSLRTNDLKSSREARDAALFAYGQSCVQGLVVGYAPVEDQDFDFVTTWVVDETRHFCPVQLKELVPEELNSAATLERLIASLCKYADASDLTVAIKMNRLGRFDPAEVVIPSSLRLGGLWTFCATSSDQNDWGIWGDFMRPESVGGAKFQYPKLLGIKF